jgi:aspartate aminotransferase
LNGDQQCVRDMNEAFRRRRDLVVEQLKDTEGVKCNLPDGAFYVFPDVSSFYGKAAGDATIEDSMDLCMYLLETAHIAAVPGSAFGAPDCIRISFANSDENLREAMKRFREAVGKLQ